MQNEYYLKAQLAAKISEFIEEECGDGDFKYISENMESHMVEAAWLIVKQNIDTNNFLEKEGFLEKS